MASLTCRRASFYRDGNRAGRWFFVGVECVNEVLALDVPWDSVIVGFPSIGDVFADFVRGGIVDDATPSLLHLVSSAC